MTREQKVILRYSISFKQKVVREIEEEGLGIAQTARRYGIRGADTVQKWVKQFGKNHLLNKIVRVEMKGEKDRTKALETEIKRLKMALADATLQKHALETLIEIVDEHYQTDVKKNFGQKPLKEAQKKKDVQ
jgi:transposase